MRAPSRARLREHLVTSRIAGDVRTPRESNLRNIELMLERAPLYTFGLELDGEWTFDTVLTLLAQRAGIDADARRTQGTDRIDPDRTLDALDAARERLHAAAVRHERVLLATGHPTGLLAVHVAVAAALRAAGAATLVPAPGWGYDDAVGSRRHLRHVAGVAMAASGAELCHTHDPAPMLGMLGALEADGTPPPDLVVADHGFAGAAGEQGIDVVGFADCNDPALFVGEAEGKVAVCVPLDDNVGPHLYDPVSAYLLSGFPAAK